MINRLVFEEMLEMFPNTDKCTLGYLPVYNGFLPDKVEKLMEIGTYKGDGIRMFRHFYNGEGEFHTMNYVFGEHEIPSKESLEKEGFICHISRDDDIESLSKITDQFDVIIEDASHCADNQIICFKHLFLNNLKPGGVYFLEDLHCCTGSPWWKNIKRFEDTALYLFRQVNQGGTFESLLISAEEDKRLRACIRSISVMGGGNDGTIGYVKKSS